MAQLKLDWGRGGTTTYSAEVRKDLEQRLRDYAKTPGPQGLAALVQDLTAGGTLEANENLVAFALAEATTTQVKLTFSDDGFEVPVELPADAVAALRAQLKQSLAGIEKPTEAVPVFLSTVLDGETPPQVELNELFPPPRPPPEPLPEGAVVVAVNAADQPKRLREFSAGYADTALGPLKANDTVDVKTDLFDRNNDVTERVVRTLEALRHLAVPVELSVGEDGDVKTNAVVERVEADSEFPMVTIISEATGREESVPMDKIRALTVLEDVPQIDLKALPKPRPLPALTLQPVDLAKAKLASGLTPEQLATLTAGGARFQTVYDFARERATGNGEVPMNDRRGVGLFIQRDDVAKRALDGAAGIIEWDYAYYEMGMQPFQTHLQNHTEVFLEMVTARDLPVVFFVPEGLMTADGVFTKKEMNWFLAHPDRLKNVTFVFGAEKALDLGDYRKLAAAYDDGNLIWGAIIGALKEGPK